MNDVLLTGPTGFVGQNLSPYLAKNGNNVLPISLRGNWKRNIPNEYDAIIHLAGKAHDTGNTSNPEEYFRINTDLTLQLYDLFLQSPARDFIYFSSVKAVADTVDGILDENAIPNPKTPYGQSKQKAEEYILSKKLPPGKRVFILRPCMIHGPGNKGNLNLLYKVVNKGIPWPLAAFENKRSFLSIHNLCLVIDRILSQPEIPGGVYNLADDEALSTNELIRLIAASAKRKPRLWKLSPGFIKTLARIGDSLHLPLNSERLKKLTESYQVSNAKIKTALGIAKFPQAAEEGLIQTINSFKNIEQ